MRKNERFFTNIIMVAFFKGRMWEVYWLLGIFCRTMMIDRATVTKTWKKQSEQFCLGLQRQGLTVSISPDEDFDGGHAGGGL